MGTLTELNLKIMTQLHSSMVTYYSNVGFGKRFWFTIMIAEIIIPKYLHALQYTLNE